MCRLRVPFVALALAGCGPEAGEVLPSEAALRITAGGMEVSFPLPATVDLSLVAVGSVADSQLDDDALVLGTVTSTGTADVGDDVIVDGDVVARGDVTIGAGADVLDVIAGGDATIGAGASTISVLDNQIFDPDQEIVLAFDVPSTANNRVTVKSGVVGVLEPDRYTTVTIRNGGTLTLESGTYFLDTFTSRGGSTVEIDDSAGPVVLVVGNSVVLDGTWTDLDTSSPLDVLVAYNGSRDVVLGTAFDGFVVAPEALVRLDDPVVAYEGAYFGETVVLSTDVRLVGRAFEPERFAPPPPPPDLAPLSLADAPVPDDGRFVQDRTALVALGKALFWDIQVGVDGQSCASCHYSAGTDLRVKNAISPGPDDDVFSPFGSGAGGPNYTLHVDDFPLRRLADPAVRTSAVVHHAGDDVISSPGTFRGEIGLAADGTQVCLADPDPLFEVAGVNTRQVPGRNAPTMINAVFNFRNFWDGRANNVFNGRNPFGLRDASAVVHRDEGSGWVSEVVAMENASLASQAVGPVLSTVEMHCGSGEADFALVGRRVLDLPILALQDVASDDSVLAPWVDPAATYRTLVETAFFPEYWDSSVLSGGLSLPESNFSLYFGLAVQAYEATLISEQTPFDAFAAGDVDALDDAQQRGLDLFFGKAKCSTCHFGPELSAAASAAFAESEIDGLVERMTMAGLGFAVYDEGFYNIGVTPADEDLGLGATDPFGVALSFARQAKAQAGGTPTADDFALDADTFDVNPGVAMTATARDAVDGAFKVPTLRNVELTGPYFHNGGQAALRQVVEFYNRGGDRLETDGGAECDNTGLGANCTNLPQAVTALGLEDDEIDDVVAFLLSLTDPRVRDEQAPFDHPSLPLSVGHAGDEQTVSATVPGICDDELVVLPAVGAGGRGAAGLPPLPTFDEVLACVDGDPDASVACFQVEYGAL